MTASTISIGLPGEEDFATPEPLRPAETLVLLLDSAADVDGAFGHRQNVFAQRSTATGASCS